MNPESTLIELERTRAMLIVIFTMCVIIPTGMIILGHQLGEARNWQNLPLHAAVEMSGAIIALIIAYVLLRLESIAEGSSFNYALAAALIGMGILDGTHSMMPSGELFVWFHCAATALGGLLFALVWLSNWVPLPVQKHYHHCALLIGLLMVAASLAYPNHLPAMTMNADFSTAAQLMNIGGGCLMLAAAIKLFLSYRSSRKLEDLLFCMQCVLFGGAAVLFEESSLWDLSWWGWHLMRLIGYCAALLLVSMAAKRIEQRMLVLNTTLKQMYEEELALGEELKHANDTLEQRVDERTEEYECANFALRETIEQLEYTRIELMKSETLAALGAMVAGVAHELNTPLGNNKLATTTLLIRITEMESRIREGKLTRSQILSFIDEGKDILDLASRSVERAIDLITSFKKVAIDQASQRRRRFDLAGLIEEILTTTRLGFKHIPLQLINNVPPGIEIDSYPGPLEQIVSNVINNSILHGFEGRDRGCITIAAHHENSASSDTPHIALTLADDGVGISADNLNRVFAPFFTTRLGQGGSGLGLHIAYRIATAVLGGNIRVESELGSGAVFTITMPMIAPVRSELKPLASIDLA